MKIKDIITRSGRCIIERILKSAKDLPHKKVPDHKRPTDGRELHLLCFEIYQTTLNEAIFILASFTNYLKVMITMNLNNYCYK